MVTRKAKVSTTWLHEFDIPAGVCKRSVKATSILAMGTMARWPVALMTIVLFGDPHKHLRTFNNDNPGGPWQLEVLNPTTTQK